MVEMKTVFIVTLLKDEGKDVGQFDSMSEAADYCNQHPYNAYLIYEKSVDVQSVKAEV